MGKRLTRSRYDVVLLVRLCRGPDTCGPRQLLEGGAWMSRCGQKANQWIVFDLGTAVVVQELRAGGLVRSF